MFSYQVNAKVSQYVSRHATNKTPSGSHIPVVATSSVFELVARSIGTSRMMLIGSARERKMGVTR